MDPKELSDRLVALADESGTSYVAVVLNALAGAVLVGRERELAAAIIPLVKQMRAEAIAKDN